MGTTRTRYTREEIIRAVRALARRLRRTPGLQRFLSDGPIKVGHIEEHFSSWLALVKAAGLKPLAGAHSSAWLLADWGRVALLVDGVPTHAQYRRHGRFGASVLCRRWGSVSAIPGVFMQWSEGRARWAKVRAILERRAAPGARVDRRRVRQIEPRAMSGRRLKDRSVFGGTMAHPCFRYEPVNEQGVVLLFGMMAHELGFVVESAQAGFPDCEALRQIAPGKWQRVRIEFEYESRAFASHGHDARGCDVLVCWRHNWPRCPAHLDVVELSKLVAARGGEVARPPSPLRAGEVSRVFE